MTLPRVGVVLLECTFIQELSITMKAKKCCVLLLAALTVLLTACDDYRQMILNSQTYNYEFDGSLPLQSIKLQPTTRKDWSSRYTPQLQSQDFYALALKTFPPSHVYEGLRLTSIDARIYQCVEMKQIDRMTYEWVVSDEQDSNHRLLIRVIVDAIVGNVDSLWEERTGTSPSSESVTVPESNLTIAEQVIQVADTALSLMADSEKIRQDTNCSAEAFTISQSPPEWMVIYSAGSLKRSVAFIVDTTTMRAELIK